MRTRTPKLHISEPDNTDWRNDAACLQEEPDLFFPHAYNGPGALQVEEAKAVCRRCPANRACLVWAITTRQSDGIWGGTTPDERGITANRTHRKAAA